MKPSLKLGASFVLGGAALLLPALLFWGRSQIPWEIGVPATVVSVGFMFVALSLWIDGDKP